MWGFIKFIYLCCCCISFLFIGFIIFASFSNSKNDLLINEWEYRETKDEVTDELSKVALYFIDKNNYAYMDCERFFIIRKEQPELSHEYKSKAILRTDKNQAVEYKTASNGLVTIIEKANEHIEQMRQGNELIIRLYNQKQSYNDYKLNLTGFNTVYSRLKKECN